MRVPRNGGPCLLSVPTVKSNGGERRAWWGVAALTLFAFTGCAERGRVRTSSAAGSSAGSTLSRAVLPAECATAPVFGWLGADQLVIQCDDRAVIVNGDGKEMERLDLVGRPLPVALSNMPKEVERVLDSIDTSCAEAERRSAIVRVDERRSVRLRFANVALQVFELPNKVVAESRMTGVLSALQVAPGGQRAATRCTWGDHTEVCLFDLETGNRIPIVSSAVTQRAAPRKVVRSEDGSRVVATFDDGLARTWNLTRGTSEVVKRGLNDGALPVEHNLPFVRCNYVHHVASFDPVVSERGDQVFVARATTDDLWGTWDLVTDVDAAAPRSPVNPDDVAHWNVGHPTDGEDLAPGFTRTARWALTGTRSRDLRLTAPDGALLATLVALPHSDAGYVVTPDGRFDVWGALEAKDVPLTCEEGGREVGFGRCGGRHTPGLLAEVVRGAR